MKQDASGATMKSVVTSALTPALSPRRGRIVRRVLSRATGRVVVPLTADDTKSVTAPRIGKLSGVVTLLTLSPVPIRNRDFSPRAGVRASVNGNSTENVEKSIFMLSRFAVRERRFQIVESPRPVPRSFAWARNAPGCRVETIRAGRPVLFPARPAKPDAHQSRLR